MTGQPEAPAPDSSGEAADGEAQHPLMMPPRPGRHRRLLFAVAVVLVAAAAYYMWSAARQLPENVAAPGEGSAVGTAASSAAQQPPGPASFRDCDACPDMLVIPAGSFLMGSPASDPATAPEEQPQHPVTIAAPFAIGRTEVTFAEWMACVADGGCDGYRPEHEGWGGGPRPVINVSWHDAQAYLTWLARKTGKPYRLPTEAEWEYATRAGTTTDYWWGDAIGHDLANCKTCGSNWDEQQTAPVASFRANPFGLFDVHGNVWEWVEDCWQPDYRAASPEGLPPRVRRGCDQRTLRGGSWDNSPGQLRSAARIWGKSDGRDNNIGFRVALPLPEDAAPASPPR